MGFEIKFPRNTRVILEGTHYHKGKTGTVVQEKTICTNTEIRLDGFEDGRTTWAQDSDMSSLVTPKKGDLVRIIKPLGPHSLKEGNVIEVSEKGVSVDLGEWDYLVFAPESLEVIEKASPKAVRIEGKEIKPEAIKRGDKISVVSVEEHEIKRTTILEATVDKIFTKSQGSVLHFQTRGGSTIFTADNYNKVVVSLVKDIDKDPEFQTLSQASIGDVIGFPDEEGGVETNIAVKKEEDLWSVLEETKSRNVQTVGLVNILKKRNVTFSVVRLATTQPKFPFAVNDNVKVSKDFAFGLSGDYKVIIPGDTNSTIKSRGISASTHSVPNKYLTKN